MSRRQTLSLGGLRDLMTELASEHGEDLRVMIMSEKPVLTGDHIIEESYEGPCVWLVPDDDDDDDDDDGGHDYESP